jgi:hypothetical protein
MNAEKHKPLILTVLCWAVGLWLAFKIAAFLVFGLFSTLIFVALVGLGGLFIVRRLWRSLTRIGAPPL